VDFLGFSQENDLRWMMYFNQNTVAKLKELAKDERFAYFFDSGKEKIEDAEADEILSILAGILVAEFNLSWDKLDKVKYFLGLGYHAHK